MLRLLFALNNVEISTETTMLYEMSIMEERYIETHESWNNVAQLYEEVFMDVEIYNDTYETFCKLLPKKTSDVLEVGCGPGNITRQILHLNPELRILATDISRNMIDLAKKNNPDINVRVLDCRELNTLGKKFDGVICGFTIPYLAKEDLSNLIANCSKTLNDDGILYLSYVEGDHKESGYISGSTGDRTYFYYYSFKLIKELLHLNNMIIVDQKEKEYNKSNGSIEIHTVLNVKKINE
jgi:2-polyprenyl-3-methyl-5-hydroxy-6-metoxy-1,4-benzoquinol methylase